MKHKLNAGEKELLKYWLGQCFSSVEVQKLLKEHCGVDITLQDISYYLNRYAENIAIRRKDFMDNIFQIPEAHPAIRIHRLAVLARKNFFTNTRDYLELIKQIREEIRFMVEITPITLSELVNKKQGKLSEEDIKKILEDIQNQTTPPENLSNSETNINLNKTNDDMIK